MRGLVGCLGLCLLVGCGEGNESSIHADFSSLRVKQIALSDESGRTVVTISAETPEKGLPIVVLKDSRGVVMQKIEIAKKE